jgi:hypothetical protein
MGRVRVTVSLGDVLDLEADVIIVPTGHPAASDPRVHVVDAPRYRLTSREYELATAYRRALEIADRRQAFTLGLPTMLSDGPWPLDDVLRISLGVFESTPSSVRHIKVATPTAAGVERWAEAIARSTF